LKQICIFLAAAIFIVVTQLGCTKDSTLLKNQGNAAQNLGEAYMAHGNYPLAFKEFLKAEKLMPKNPYVQNNLGLIYMVQDKWNMAILHFNRAIKINPNYSDAKNNLGAVYLIKKDWNRAIGIFNEVENDALYTTPHNALFNLGVAYYNKKSYKISKRYFHKVLDYYERGFAKDITYIKTLKGLGNNYLALGRIIEAKEILERAVELAPEYAPLYLDLAKVYQCLDENTKAIKSIEKVIKLAPASIIRQKAELIAEQIKTKEQTR